MAMPIIFSYQGATLLGMSTIGVRIRALRKSKDLNQTQLGERVGVDQSTISDIENGSNTNPEVFLRICDVLETTPEYLVRGQVRDTEGEDRVLAIYRALSPPQRGNMVVMAAALKSVEAAPESGGGPTEPPVAGQKKRRA